MVGGDTIKVSQKKMEDMEEGSSGRKKQKRKEEEEIKVEFGLVVEELWGWIVRRWEESEWRQEQRWADMMATLECIVDDVQDLLDGMVLEEKEKGKEIRCYNSFTYFSPLIFLVYSLHAPTSCLLFLVYILIFFYRLSFPSCAALLFMHSLMHSTITHAQSCTVLHSLLTNV